MPLDRRPYGAPLHATAVVLGGDALLILGRSGSGKSRLARALIDASTRRLPIRLLGDDRILLSQQDDRIVACGHPRIRGFIERRGLGIEAVPFVVSATVAGIVDLSRTTPRPSSLQNFPTLSLVTPDVVEARRDLVLEWWRGASTTQTAKSAAVASGGVKD